MRSLIRLTFEKLTYMGAYAKARVMRITTLWADSISVVRKNESCRKKRQQCQVIHPFTVCSLFRYRDKLIASSLAYHTVVVAVGVSVTVSRLCRHTPWRVVVFTVDLHVCIQAIISKTLAVGLYDVMLERPGHTSDDAAQKKIHVLLQPIVPVLF